MGQQGGSKKKRTHKTSQGIHGATHWPLTVVEKVLAGKGLIAAFVPVECKVPWRGVGDDQIAKRGPWNAANVAENKKLYPHLFPELRKKVR